MIERDIRPLLEQYQHEFRSIAIVGPRQSGKSTTAKAVFPHKPYISLEDPDERVLAEIDTRQFLSRFPNGAIIDEAQRAPAIFNYLQGIIDTSNEDGLFVLTGSNNFLLQKNITQSLAGRIGYIDLFPLTVREINLFGKEQNNIDLLLLSGCFPEIYDKKRSPNIWYPSFIRTYVERDVKQILNIENSILFTKFLKICAGRIGQMLNANTLSIECGIDVKTVNAWLGILQSSFIVFLLPPHHKNFNKRVTRSPKLYFTDTGLACSLLGIKKEQELALSYFRGSLFENFVVMEIKKNIANHGLPHDLYYWRDSNGVEIDLLIDKGNGLLPIEIKSAKTYQPVFTKNLEKWNKYANLQGGAIIYDGVMEYTNGDGYRILNWKNAHSL